MASGAPNLFQVLPPIVAGTAESLVFSVTSQTSNPNNWSEVRLTITPPGGDPVEVTTPTITTSVSGASAPWTITITAPLSAADTAALNPDDLAFVKCDYELSYKGSTAADIGVIESGTVEVFKARATLPA